MQNYAKETLASTTAIDFSTLQQFVPHLQMAPILHVFEICVDSFLPTRIFADERHQIHLYQFPFANAVKAIPIEIPNYQTPFVLQYEALCIHVHANKFASFQVGLFGKFENESSYGILNIESLQLSCYKLAVWLSGTVIMPILKEKIPMLQAHVSSGDTSAKPDTNQQFIEHPILVMINETQWLPQTMNLRIKQVLHNVVLPHACFDFVNQIKLSSADIVLNDDTMPQVWLNGHVTANSQYSTSLYQVKYKVEQQLFILSLSQDENIYYSSIDVLAPPFIVDILLKALPPCFLYDQLHDMMLLEFHFSDMCSQFNDQVLACSSTQFELYVIVNVKHAMFVIGDLACRLVINVVSQHVEQCTIVLDPPLQVTCSIRTLPILYIGDMELQLKFISPHKLVPFDNAICRFPSEQRTPRCILQGLNIEPYQNCDQDLVVALDLQIDLLSQLLTCKLYTIARSDHIQLEMNIYVEQENIYEQSKFEHVKFARLYEYELDLSNNKVLRSRIRYPVMSMFQVKHFCDCSVSCQW